MSIEFELVILKNTMLDIRFIDSKTNSAMAWSNKADFECSDTFKENASYPSSEVPSDVKLVEKNFERAFF
jgi:hypothetical protein